MNSDPYFELDNTRNTTKRPEVKEFWGTSRGFRTGHVFGRIHCVNNQVGLHGWQRVTMFKCFEDSTGGYDGDSVWVYEGVVLPGGRIILGRWNHPSADPTDPDSHFSGPFIFWNVEHSSAEPPIEPEDAWRFGEKIDDPLFEGLFL